MRVLPRQKFNSAGTLDANAVVGPVDANKGLPSGERPITMPNPIPTSGGLKTCKWDLVAFSAVDAVIKWSAKRFWNWVDLFLFPCSRTVGLVPFMESSERLIERHHTDFDRSWLMIKLFSALTGTQSQEGAYVSCMALAWRTSNPTRQLPVPDDLAQLFG